MRYILSTILLLLFLLPLSAQEKKGDQLYDQLGYLSAVQEYQNMKVEDMNFEIKEKLANSYRLNSQFESAEYWYAQIVQEADDPITLLHYAQMLQSNDKCEDAIRWYQTYKKRSSDSHRSFIEDCTEIETFEKHANIEVNNESSLNSDKHDFSPLPFKNGLLFTSMRKPQKNGSSKNDLWTDGHYSDLYFVEKKGESYSTPEPLEGAINGEYHDGVACFDPINKELLFTRNTIKGKSEEGIKNLKIYSTKEEDGQWLTPQELSFNDNEFSCSHPTISSDGQRLYFASDRSDGFGGMDIYVSERSGTNWGTPTNLGPIVNSSGNEIFPFLSEKGKLFYASDGHKGFGGLDIFVVEKSTDDDERSWADRKNIGSPFNSNKDDFGFYIDAPEEQGFLSSNRNGGSSGDDIYSWEQTEKNTLDPFDPTPISGNTNLAPIVAMLQVCDQKTKEPLSEAKVGIIKTAANWTAFNAESATPQSLITTTPSGEYNIKITGGTLRADASLSTNANGEFQYFYQPEETYALFAESGQYAPTYKQYTGWEISQLTDKCIYLNTRNCVPLNGKVVNKKFQSPIASTTINLINLCDGEITELQSDQNGLFNFCLDCNCDYELVTANSSFLETRATIEKSSMDCSQKQPLTMVVGMDIAIKSPTEQELTNQYINEYFTGEKEANYQEGQILRLNNIYYDFDKSNIRGDAAYELDFLVTLMEQHPSMEIELHAHTDSRGKSDYNGWLSQFRANAARKYLLKKGIDRNRIHKAKGFGESQLFNHCANGEDCTEKEHQQNRRTEVKIVRFNGALNEFSQKDAGKRF